MKELKSIWNNINSKWIKTNIRKILFKKTNKEIKFTTKTAKETQGYFGNESEYAKTRYYLEQEIQIINITKIAKLELTEEEIKKILKEILTQYEITYISFKSGFEYQSQYEFKSPVFKEVKIHFVQKEQNQTQGFGSTLNMVDTSHQRAQSMHDPRNTGGHYEDWSLRRKF